MESSKKIIDDNIFVGCAGFSNRDWKDIFYPENLSSKDYLSYYSQQLNAVEINSTFYRRPQVKTLEKMYNETPIDFKFFIKIPKTITHLKKLDETKEITEEFCIYIQLYLKEKLAGFLFQLSPSFHYSEQNLFKVLETVNSQFLNVFEFRHESWWNEDVLKDLEQKNIVFAGVSIPKNIPDDFIINNTNFAYYRLHGVPTLFKSEYSNDFIKKLAENIQKFKRTTFVMFNNTWGNAGIKNALELKKILKKINNF